MLFLVLATLVADNPVPDFDPPRFARILEGLHAEIEDFELVCEGRVLFVDPNDPNKLRKQAKLDRTFQRTYAFRRSDGAGYQDLYAQLSKSGELAFSRTTSALLRGEVREVIRIADQKAPPGPVRVENGGPGSLMDDGSPERFIHYWFWKRFCDDPGSYACRFEGWEEVSGHRCLRVDIDRFPTYDGPDKKHQRFWIDLERGGHTLREEFYGGGDLWYRLHNVELSRVATADGKSVWFPEYAEFDTFVNGDRFLTTPVLHQTYGIVKGSLVINEGLTDARFSIDWGVAKSERRWRSPAEARTKQLRTDPAGVQQQLEAKLAEADRQARQLEAYPPSRRTWDSTMLAQAVLGLLGLTAVVVAVILRRKGA